MMIRERRFHQSVARLFLSLFVSLLTAISTNAQNREQLLIYGVTGSDNSGAYSRAISRVAVQKLLLDLAAAPARPNSSTTL